MDLSNLNNLLTNLATKIEGLVAAVAATFTVSVPLLTFEMISVPVYVPNLNFDFSISHYTYWVLVKTTGGGNPADLVSFTAAVVLAGEATQVSGTFAAGGQCLIPFAAPPSDSLVPSQAASAVTIGSARLHSMV